MIIEKEQALHCDEYNENLTGGVGDGAGVPQKKPGKIDVKEEIVKDDDADVIDVKDIVTEISLCITKFKKKRSAIHETWTKMLLSIMDICRTNNVEKRECDNLCHQLCLKDDDEGFYNIIKTMTYNAKKIQFESTPR